MKVNTERPGIRPFRCFYYLKLCRKNISTLKSCAVCAEIHNRMDFMFLYRKDASIFF